MDDGEFTGSMQECSLSPRRTNYSYRDMMRKLRDTFDFEKIGEGSFGVIMAGQNCAVKIIKNLDRCHELSREVEIYEAIEKAKSVHKKDRPLLAQIPTFHIFTLLDSFCHFNMERMYSPMSVFGDVAEDDEDACGHGYITEQPTKDEYIMQTDKGPLQLSRDEVYPIGRPGNLIHFYVNHRIEPNARYKLDHGQGVVMGPDTLVHVFGRAVIQDYVFHVGACLAFLVFEARVIPVDVEVVLGTRSRTDRLVVPFIYDFNEASLYNVDDITPEVVERIARAMSYKNGKNYFPDRRSAFYPDFARGFTQSGLKGAHAVLEFYNKLLN